MKQVKIKPSQNIYLSVVGTTNTLQIVFPIVKEWKKNYGEGEFSLAVRRPVDKEAYLAPITADSENVYWTVTNTDTQYPGPGQYQLIYYVNGDIAKTVIGNTVVDKSLGQTNSAPAPWSDYIKQVLDAKEKYIKAGNGIVLENSSDGWVYINIDDDVVATKEYVNEFGGKIDSISVNGIEQEVDENKNVNINITVNDELAESKELPEIGKVTNIDLGYNVITETSEDERETSIREIGISRNFSGVIKPETPEIVQSSSAFCTTYFLPVIDDNTNFQINLNIGNSSYIVNLDEMETISSEEEYYSSDLFHYLEENETDEIDDLVGYEIFDHLEWWENSPGVEGSIYYKEIGNYKDNPVYLILFKSNEYHESVGEEASTLDGHLIYTERASELPELNFEINTTSEGITYLWYDYPSIYSILPNGFNSSTEELLEYLKSSENIYSSYFIPSITNVTKIENITTSEKFEKAVESIISKAGDSVIDIEIYPSYHSNRSGLLSEPTWFTVLPQNKVYELLKDAKEARVFWKHLSTYTQDFQPEKTRWMLVESSEEPAGEEVIDYFKIISIEKVSNDNFGKGLSKSALPIDNDSSPVNEIMISFEVSYVGSGGLEEVYFEYGHVFEKETNPVNFRSSLLSNNINNISVNGTILDPVAKVVNVRVPTTTSELINNSNYIDQSTLMNSIPSGYGYCGDDPDKEFKSIKINLNDLPNVDGSGSIIEFFCWFENGVSNYIPLSSSDLQVWENRITFELTYLNGESGGVWPHLPMLAQYYKVLGSGRLSEDLIRLTGIPRGLKLCRINHDSPDIIKIYDLSSLFSLDLSSYYMTTGHQFVNEQTISVDTEVSCVYDSSKEVSYE